MARACAENYISEAGATELAAALKQNKTLTTLKENKTRDCFEDAPNLFFPAIITPLSSDGQLDERSARSLCRHLYEQGVGGLYVLGGTGDGLHLSSSRSRD